MCGEEPGLEEVMVGPEEERNEKSTPSPALPDWHLSLSPKSLMPLLSFGSQETIASG